MENKPILKVEGICKNFPGVKALDNINLEIFRGDVHALVGENGAGKSTLMHILAGVHRPDSGKIFFEGKAVEITDQKCAQQLGISIVYQERSLVADLSIAENIFAGRQPVGILGMVDFNALYKKAAVLLKRLELDLDPRIVVGRLSPAKQQMVEIAKALSLDVKLLILDEPTSTITEVETKALFKVIEQLRGQGIAIIYISHRLAEIEAICNRVSVLKDGRYVGTVAMAETTLDEIVKMMVGRELSHQYQQRENRFTDTALEVKCLNSSYAGFKNISFAVKKGEILAFAGLAGAGRTEVARAIFGADPLDSGEITIKGRKVQIKSSEDAIHLGLGYLPEDRKDQGLFLEMNLAENLAAAKLTSFAANGFMKDNQIAAVTTEYVQKLRVAASGIKQKVINLSGGNQQKVILARWLYVNPDILIVDEPTRGVDVGAKAEIYSILRELANNGTAVIVISSELPEVLALGDRIIVMWQGIITGELSRADASEEKIMHLASGLLN